MALQLGSSINTGPTGLLHSMKVCLGISTRRTSIVGGARNWTVIQHSLQFMRHNARYGLKVLISTICRTKNLNPFFPLADKLAAAK